MRYPSHFNVIKSLSMTLLVGYSSQNIGLLLIIKTNLQINLLLTQFIQINKEWFKWINLNKDKT
ncbi:hypothetical protein OOC_11866 [Providencia rettgeri Dmel1]|nr:hypothetical protein AM461_13395 [Providencia rettgeri]EKT56912.1 hypothetical protein OOC_11866 [Providencia rettgeri Dmel1]